MASEARALELDVLPETAGVHWRPRVDEARLRRVGALWTLTTVAHVVPFLGAAALLVWLNPLALPVALACVAHAWVIPELYARRGANVLRPRARAAAEPERRSVGLLGDLVDHDARELHAATGLVLEPGRLGTWLVGEGGALLLSRRRAYCWCIRVDSRIQAASTLPSGDRIAHLLLAPARRRAGLRDRREPQLRGRALAPSPPRGQRDATGHSCGRNTARHPVHRSPLNPGHAANAAICGAVQYAFHARLRRSHPPHPRTGQWSAGHRSNASGPSLQDGSHGSRQSGRSDARPLRASAPKLRLTLSRPALARWPARYA